ncbi:uncharacterized protein LOC142233037 [Haematobia irritans]|uniref:uncharacterized protein LOC142230787 n=1 Tax=Haematobia irritans TaxID=7368 RepID=UPI003F5025DA
MCDLSALINDQRQLLNLLVKYQSRFVVKHSAEKTHGYVSALAQRIDDIFNRFEAQHETIVEHVRDNSINSSEVPYLNDDFYLDFSETYFTFKGMLIDSFPDRSVSHSPMASTFVAPHGRSDTTIISESKLPKISIPKFSGEYIEWIPFRDIYFSLVHQNDSLNKIQKFYYLRSTLEGEAANLIKNISATEANYDSAWKILESRYHNKRMLVGNLISKLFNIPKSEGDFQSIKTLLDSAQECISSLQNLDINTKTWDPLLIHLLVQKLDIQSRRDWEQSLKSSTEIPQLSELFLFLERTFRTLESIAGETTNSPKNFPPRTDKYQNSSQTKKATFHSGLITKPDLPICVFCEKNHNLTKCYKFLALPRTSKINFLNDKNICFNCFIVGHNHDNCTSIFRCATCQQPHHTVIHPEDPVSPIPNPPTQVTSHSAQSFSSVLLYTIRLNVNTSRGRFQLRALLDPGSQGSLISEQTVEKLALTKTRSNCRVVGIGNHHGDVSKFTVELNLVPRNENFGFSCTALVLPTISSYAPDPSSQQISLPEIARNNLADPWFYNSDPIDLILGSDICSEIKLAGQSFIHKGLFFQNTCFGWVFSGSSIHFTYTFTFIHINFSSMDN